MKIAQAGSHLDHLVRQTRLHHMQLSSMADFKASMLLTVASVVVTLSVPQLQNAELRWAVVVLMVFSLLAVILAAYAVMPKISSPKAGAAPPDFHSPSFNILFFGDFLRVSYEDYEARMEEIMNDPSEAYQVQLREIYRIGEFLAKMKFRFVRLAYVSFICGLALASLVLLFTVILFPETKP